MRCTSCSSIVALLAVIFTLLDQSGIGSVEARKPSRPPPGPAARRGLPPAAKRPPSRRPPVEEDEDYEDPIDGESDDGGILGRNPGESEEDEEDAVPPPRKRRPAPSKAKPSKSSAKPPPRKRPVPAARDYDDDYAEEEEEDDYERRPSRPIKRPSAGNSRSHRGAPPPKRGPPPGKRSVVPYGRPARPSAAANAAATFTKGWTAITSVMPDPAAVREGVVSSISAARETTSLLSSNIYREVKGLTSSELEQVMLKATRPDDSAVKGKHVERLVGVTYQISSRYDIYDAVLRKLWGKMVEKDWRTTIKALYILHRYSADGAPEHSQALKARLRELRRTKDPKRKDKYFNSKQMLAGDSRPDNFQFRAFLARYSHYVLLRAQCFGGMFDEISQKPIPPKVDKKSSAKAQAKIKPITSTCLRVEHLEAAMMLLKAGLACQLREGESCENTAIAVERVASDLIGLTTAIAIALNRALKGDTLEGADPAIIKRWCTFYGEECLPQTRAFVKKTAAKLDAFQLFLPTRMGATVSPETLQKGLKAEEMAGAAVAQEGEGEDSPQEAKKAEPEDKEEEEEKNDDEEEVEDKPEDVVQEKEGKKPVVDDVAFDDGDEEYDEYEYDEEAYYDEE